MAEATMTLRELNRATLARQMMLARERVTPRKALERLAGMQAQLPRPPHVGMWSRVAGFKRGKLNELVAGREAVRGPLLRCTLHLVTAEDYAAWRPLLQPTLDAGMRSAVGKRLGKVDLPELATAARAFFDEEPRTMDALREHLEERRPRDDTRALALAVRMRLPVVQVPGDGTWGYPGAARFAAAETYLGAPLGAGGSAADLALRYLAALGPATPADAASWSGVPALKAAMLELRPRLTVLRDERGRELFDLPRAPRPPGDTPAPVRFLAEWDNVLLGHTPENRRRVIAEDHRKAIYGANLLVPPTVWVDGFVAGTWKVQRARTTAKLQVTMFDGVGKAARAEVVEEGEALLRFLEEDASKLEVRIA